MLGCFSNCLARQSYDTLKELLCIANNYIYNLLRNLTKETNLNDAQEFTAGFAI